MKIGDKVRFLNDVGGGVITGFQDKNTVLVSDADGFEIPTLMKDVVVVETDDYNIVRKVKQSAPLADAPTVAAPTSVKQALAAGTDESEEEAPDLADLPLTYQPMAQERRGGDALNVSLAFVPTDSRRISDTTFDVYLINDSNYYVHHVLLTADDELYALKHTGELQPNTKQWLETLTHADLPVWEHLTVQLTAYKRDKAFRLQPAADVHLKIDGTKFYKLHTFQPSPFFQQGAWVCPLLVEGQPQGNAPLPAEQTARLASFAPYAAPAGITGAQRRAEKRQAAADAAAGQVVEIDLHAHELLDTMVGLQPHDIFDYQMQVFRQTMEAHLRHRGQRIVFIHGKGDGVLRQAIRQALARTYPTCHVQDASFRQYGFGATMVTIG